MQSFLVSERAQRAHIPTSGLTVDFAAGDTIHTESSYKFTRDEIVRLATECGFAEQKTYTDTAGRYALTLLIVV